MTRKLKKVLALLLTLSMVMGMFTVGAIAAGCNHEWVYDHVQGGQFCTTYHTDIYKCIHCGKEEWKVGVAPREHNLVITTDAVDLGNIGDYDTDLSHTVKCTECTYIGTEFHSFADATCTAPATCACGHEKLGSEPLGHDWSAEWSKDETNHWHDCTRTDCEEKRDVAAHTWNDGEVTTEPTCIAEGVKTYTCTVAGCGATKTEAVAMAAHTWNDGEVTTEPTCIAEGVKTYTCTVAGCGATKTEAVAMAAHTWNDGEVTTEPTCIAEGVKTYTCTVAGCSATKTEAVAMAAHTWNDGEVTTEPTCIAEGVKTYTCTVAGCSATKTEAVATVDHTWNEGVVTKEPTYDAEGERTFTCTICGHTRTESIPALDRPYTPPTTTYYNLTINYVDGEGNTVADSYTARQASGWSYSVSSPAVEGMTPDREIVSGTLNRSLTVTVVYTAVPEENVDETEPPLTETPETAEPAESAETEAAEEAEDLGDNDTPLSETPDVETAEPAETEELDENDTPLADVPQTGDALWVWMVLALLSAAGLAWVGLKGKKGKRA